MDKEYFDQRKSEILKKIQEAVQLGDSRAIHSYARMMLSLENEYKKDRMEEGRDIKRVQFSASRWEI